MFLWISLTNHPHVSLQACSMVVQRAAIWRHLYRLTILLEVSQSGSVGRKMRPSVLMLFSWITSSAAWPTCRYGLLSRSPEARGNLVWCYTGRNNQEQWFYGVFLHKIHLDMDRTGFFWWNPQELSQRNSLALCGTCAGHTHPHFLLPWCRWRHSLCADENTSCSDYRRVLLSDMDLLHLLLTVSL